MFTLTLQTLNTQVSNEKQTLHGSFVILKKSEPKLTWSAIVILLI